MKTQTVIVSGLFTLCMALNSAQAQNERMGVATYEEKQRREAIVSAQMARPENDNAELRLITPDEKVVLDVAPSQLEKNVSKSHVGYK